MPVTQTPADRARAHALQIVPESTRATDPGSGYKTIATEPINVEALVPDRLQNDAQKVSLRGVNPAGIGLKGNKPINATTYLEGLGDSNDSGDGDTPASTALTHLCEAFCGQDARNVTGDTVDSAADASTITPVTLANFTQWDAIGLIDPSTDFFHMRFIESKTTDLNLNCPLPFTPSNADVIYGSNSVEWQPKLENSFWVRLIGKHASQNFALKGCVADFALPETSGNAPQKANWTIIPSDFDELVSLTEVDPDSFRPNVLAGGDFKIRKVGETAWYDIDFLRASFASGQVISPDEDANSRFNIGALNRVDQDMSLSIHLKNRASTPTGVSASTWREIFGVGNEADNQFDVQLSYTRAGRGQSFALYFPRWQINAPVEHNLNVDEKSLQKIMLQPMVNQASPAMIMAQG